MRYPGAEWRPIAINYRSGGNIPTLMIIHIMQGTLAGSDSWFRNPKAQVSAHFGVGKGGEVYQWVDTHDTAWHAMSANDRSIGVEHEGDSGEKLTAAQLEADEKLFAWAVAHHDIPLRLAQSPNSSGLAYHALGAAGWGGHLQCPGGPIIGQLGTILKGAKAIHGGKPPAPAPPAARHWQAEGMLTLAALCAADLHEPVSEVLTKTARNSPGHAFAANLASHLKAIFSADATHCPAGTAWYYPAGKGVEAWVSKGMLSLSALASELDTDPATMIALTIQHAGQLQPVNSGYINAVAAAATIHLPPGVVVYY